MTFHKIEEIVNKNKGNILVTGPPGSGKTHLLIELVRFLILSRKISPERLLIFSFNRRWSKIIRQRTAVSLNRSIPELPVETFYSFCQDLIMNMPPAGHVGCGVPGSGHISCNHSHCKNLDSGHTYSGYMQYDYRKTGYEATGEAFLADLLQDKKILTSTEQWRLLKEVISDLDRKDFPISCRYAGSSPHIFNSYMQEVFDFILRAQENLLTPAVLLERLTPYTDANLSEIAAIYRRYIKRLSRDRLYNYGMLLMEAVGFLKSNKKLKEFYRGRYEYILVDEFQEINRAQLEIIKNISSSNCVFFGNDQEAIYSFRGSQINNFRNIFNKIDPGNILLLEDNYRSTALIQEICEGIINLNRSFAAVQGSRETKTYPKEDEAFTGFDKKYLKENKDYLKENKTCPMNVKTGSKDNEKGSKYNGNCSKEHGPDPKIDSTVPEKGHMTRPSGGNADGEVQVRDFYSALEEANYVCRKIKTLYIEGKVKMEETAIIIKGLGYETHIMENALLHNGIPYIRRSSRSLLDNYYIRYLVMLLKLISSLKSRRSRSYETGIDGKEEEIDLQLEFILFSGCVDLEPISFRMIMEQRRNIHGGTGQDLWQFLKGFINKMNGGMNTGIEYGRYLEGIRTLINSIESYIEEDHSDAYRFILKLVNDPIIGIFRNINTGVNNKRENKNILMNLGDYLKGVKSYCQGGNPPDLKSYLEFIGDMVENQFLEEMEESTKDFQEEGLVNLISFHQSKGLEFKAVFIPFLNGGYLPAGFRRPQIYDLQLFNYLQGEKRLDLQELKEEHLESEIRLFYTGISRAGRYLYITASKLRQSSIFFENARELRNACDNMTGPCKKAGTKDGFGSKKYGRLLQDITQPWLLKKKGIVSAARSGKSLKKDRDRKKMIAAVLKYFYPPEDWWDILKYTENKKNPYRVFKKPFSVSELDTYRECPFKYKVRYYFNLEIPKNINMVLGSIYHRIMKLFFESEDVNYDWEVFAGLIEREFDRACLDYDFLKEQLKEKAYRDFNNYYRNHMPAGSSWIEMEKKFCFKAGDDRISGRIDQIVLSGPDKAEIIDFKSGSRRYSEKDLKDELQLKIYRMALETSPDLKDYLRREIDLKYLSLGEHKKTLYCIPREYYHSGDMIERIKTILEGIKKEEFRPSPGGRAPCFNCDFKILCPYYYG